MKIGIFSRVFPDESARCALAHAAEAGYSSVHYNMSSSGLESMPQTISSKDCDAITKAAEDYKLNIVGISGTYNMAHPDKSIRIKGTKRIEIIGIAAQRIGIPLISLCTGTRDTNNQWKYHQDNATPAAWSDFVETLQQVILIADQLDVNLGIEPEQANIINSADTAKQLIDEMKSSRIKIILDPANLFEETSLSNQRHIIDKFFDLLGNHIVMIHAKDRYPNGKSAPAGDGIIDFRHCLFRAKLSEFNGPIIAHDLPASKAPKAAQYLHRLVKTL